MPDHPSVEGLRSVASTAVEALGIEFTVPGPYGREHRDMAQLVGYILRVEADYLREHGVLRGADGLLRQADVPPDPPYSMVILVPVLEVGEQERLVEGAHPQRQRPGGRGQSMGRCMMAKGCNDLIIAAAKACTHTAETIDHSNPCACGIRWTYNYNIATYEPGRLEVREDEKMPRETTRWYGFMQSWTGDMGTAQIDSALRSSPDRRVPRSLKLPEPVLRLAQAEYDARYPGQPYERMQERGGLSVLEIVALLADRVQRLEQAAAKMGA